MQDLLGVRAIWVQAGPVLLISRGLVPCERMDWSSWTRTICDRSSVNIVLGFFVVARKRKRTLFSNFNRIVIINVLLFSK